MPRLPQIKPRDVEKVLLKKGFSPRPTKSSHVVFVHPNGQRTVVPAHNRPVSTGTLRAILRQSDITVEDFLKLL
ncbi:MAG: type II toxin-antitoxin system HicA family toxin [Patescibacteria group bacterium]|nr:type II toxin-antitoxin system HicA family toxin [Patescibacteria group bacterium]MCL5432018.1 type II toxin-antitoxin system HicA family toxin [Patescibacteria group bacterium]